MVRETSMASVKDPKPRRGSRRKGKTLSAAQVRKKRGELVGRAADLVIEVHRDALKELERH
jgi:hypothetical protein